MSGFYINEHGHFVRKGCEFNYDPETLSHDVMNLLKNALPQPIYEEIKEINIPRRPNAFEFDDNGKIYGIWYTWQP